MSFQEGSIFETPFLKRGGVLHFELTEDLLNKFVVYSLGLFSRSAGKGMLYLRSD